MSASHPVAYSAIDGPDYVALVIEWDDIDDLTDDLDELDDPADHRDTMTMMIHEPVRSPRLDLVAVVGALGVLALAVWGARRLSAA